MHMQSNTSASVAARPVLMQSMALDVRNVRCGAWKPGKYGMHVCPLSYLANAAGGTRAPATSSHIFIQTPTCECVLHAADLGIRSLLRHPCTEQACGPSPHTRLQLPLPDALHAAYCM